jgi:hypothetical protein
MEKDRFESIKHKFGAHASWAIWSDPDAKGAEGIGDLSIFDSFGEKSVVSQLHTNYVLFGLNMSALPDQEPNPLRNFHATNGGRDFMLRSAIRGTPLWGSYITDFLVGVPNLKDGVDLRYSADVIKWSRLNPEIIKQQATARRAELEEIGGANATFVAMGGAVYRLLEEFFADSRIIRIMHYSTRHSAEKQRARVVSALSELGGHP